MFWLTTSGHVASVDNGDGTTGLLTHEAFIEWCCGASVCCAVYMDTYSLDSFSYLKTEYTDGTCTTVAAELYYRILPASLPATYSRVTPSAVCSWNTPSLQVQASNDGIIWGPFSNLPFTMAKTLTGWKATSSFLGVDLIHSNATPVGTFTYSFTCVDVGGTFTSLTISLGVS